MATATSKLTKSEAGRLGNLARWGPPRVVKLHDLEPNERALIVELVAQARAAKDKAAADQDPATAKPEEGTHDAARRTS